MKNKLNLKLEGKNSNAFTLLAYFREDAKRAGWTKQEIDEKVKDATSGDYDHLLNTLIDC